MVSRADKRILDACLQMHSFHYSIFSNCIIFSFVHGTHIRHNLLLQIICRWMILLDVLPYAEANRKLIDYQTNCCRSSELNWHHYYHYYASIVIKSNRSRIAALLLMVRIDRDRSRNSSIVIRLYINLILIDIIIFSR